ALRGKQPDEYFAYDPRPVMLRNRDVRGGLDKRHMTVGNFFGHYLDFIHRIIGRYHPLRVAVMYPFYLALCYFIAVGTIWRHSRRYRTCFSHLGAGLQLLVELPIHIVAGWLRVIRPSGAAKVEGARLQTASEGAPQPR